MELKLNEGIWDAHVQVHKGQRGGVKPEGPDFLVHGTEHMETRSLRSPTSSSYSISALSSITCTRAIRTEA